MRWLFLLFFLTSICGMGFALYLQYVEHLEPCNLCILQRAALIYIGVISFFGWIHSPRYWGIKVYGLLAFIGAAVGAAIAGRHVWMQGLPADEVPECGPGLEFMLNSMPWSDALGKVLLGSGSCAKIDLMYFGLTIPGMTFYMFLTIAGLLLLGLVWPSRKAKVNHGDIFGDDE